MRNVLAFFFVCVLAGVAHASYLYWEVNPDAGNLTVVQDYATDLGFSWNQVTLYAVSGNTKTAIEDPQTPLEPGGDVGPTWTDISSYTAYSFYIELANYNDSTSTKTVLGYSKAVSYANLSAHIVSAMGEVPAADVWHGGVFTATPEPTGALLMLIGVGVLGLRRRERKAA